ncbi:holo-ACP synthase [Thalassotalea atypica]|uniref:holo-ACP synthase n=1 Tax=Thalassotalea atypica TaxID=2054316 RepID=UPI002573A4E4|nr:holo-ACP synthase [Thalassotalea atypica]
MSVVGVGTDIVDISRIENMREPALSKLARRVLTDAELAHYQTIKYAYRFLAKRWAAKEAASKALGTGIAAGVSFQHFEIQSLPSGQPKLHLSGKALELVSELGANSWHISISDESNFATAFVVLSN